MIATRVSTRAVTARKAARSTRLVVAATSDRRLLAGVAATFAALTLSSGAAQALSGVDIIDDRKAIAKGFDLIYEARELTLPQSARDGFDQARSDLGATKKRVSEAQKRIAGDVNGFISKKYWTEAREELRRQVGTLRFDLKALAATKTKAEKKAAEAAIKTAFNDIEALDLEIREKDQVGATKAFAVAIKSLQAAIATVA